MKNQALIYGVVGLVIGGLLVGFTATLAVNNNNQPMMRMMGMNTMTNSQGMMDNDDMSMGQMMQGLQGKSGDEFDQTFISEMVMHHQGAIDMARLAQTGAKHQEIKDMADDIISAQSKEIDMMRTWQTNWGYKNTPQMQHQMMGN